MESIIYALFIISFLIHLYNVLMYRKFIVNNNKINDRIKEIVDILTIANEEPKRKRGRPKKK